MDKAGLQKQYGEQLDTRVAEIEKQKKDAVENLISNAKDKEEQVESAYSQRITAVENEVSKTEDQIKTYDNALNDPNLPGSEKKKIKKFLDDLRRRKVFLLGQLSKLKARLKETTNMLWFNVRSQKSMIESSSKQRVILEKRRFSEIISHLAKQVMEKRKVGGEGAVEGGKVGA